LLPAAGLGLEVFVVNLTTQRRGDLAGGRLTRWAGEVDGIHGARSIGCNDNLDVLSS